jgi:hypothetical protein
MSSLDHATLYAAEWNFAVFPVHWILDSGECSCRKIDCPSAGKHPIVAAGFRSASKDLEQIKSWWGKYPQANIGIATGKVSGVVVLDVDPRHGGFDSLVKYSLPPTMKARTGGSGEHYYFRPSDDIEIRNSAGKLGAGLDVRGEGGYVVAPPSNHLLGVYEWERWDEIAELPAMVRTACVSGQPRTDKDKKKETHPLTQAVLTGRRNSTLASLAGSMRHRGFSREAITRALLAENKQRCQPPLDSAEVRDIARSISRYNCGEDRRGGAGPRPLTEAKNEGGQGQAPPLQNSLRVWNLNEFLNQTFETKENICFEAGGGDLVMVAARTNGGKSTLLRNCLLSLATGRKFGAFVPEQRPRRVLLLDFEADGAELQQDLARMTRALSIPEREMLAENFQLVPKGIIGKELFQLNQHFNFVHDIMQRNASEVIVIDNISSAFSLKDENNNAEVTGKIVKPLCRLAQISGAVVIFAHHIGKVNETLRDDVYLGRGASTLACLAKTVFNLRGRVDLGENVEICCVKRKNGHNYKRILSLNPETRWFESTSASRRKLNNYDLIVGWLREKAPRERPAKTSELVSAFPRIGRTSLMLNLREAIAAGDVLSPQRAYYCANPKDSDI